MKSKLLIMLLILVTVFITPLSVSAETFTPYLGYEINDYNESVASPIGYKFLKKYDSKSIGLEIDLESPQDMCIKNDSIYILDSGNGRIVQTTTDFTNATIIDNFIDKNGISYDITGAKGITVGDDGAIYIADTSNYQILKFKNGVIIQVIGKPDTAILSDDMTFNVTKVAVDFDDRLYAVAENINLGSFVFDKFGNFERFYGSNTVVQTSEVITNYIKKQFLTAEQRAGLISETPTIFSNFDIDKYGFVYTVTPDASGDSTTGIVRRLNYKGSDIISSDITFGDVEKDGVFWSESLHTEFSDVDIDDNEFINLIDKGRGKVFQYSPEGKLVAVFGGYGTQLGTFSIPVAIESLEDNIYVLDSEKKCIFSFEPTIYGQKLRTAILKTKNNESDALETWQEILNMNTNSQYAYYGIGTVYETQGDHKEAMEYFRLANAHKEYSKSFREYRKILVKENIGWTLFVIVSIITILLFCLSKISKKFILPENSAYSPIEVKSTFPIYTLRHPIDGFEQLRMRDVSSFIWIAIFVVSWFLVETWEFFGLGFSFNENRPQDYNIFVTFLSTIGLFVLFVIANWAICTLIEGKGSLKEITTVSAYSLFPMIVCSIIRIIVSNFLTIEESAFLSIIITVGIIWSICILFFGLQAIHQYSFGKTILSVFLTLIGMFVIAFLLIMFYSLMQQTISFAISLYEEFSMR